MSHNPIKLMSSFWGENMKGLCVGSGNEGRAGSRSFLGLGGTAPPLSQATGRTWVFGGRAAAAPAPSLALGRRRLCPGGAATPLMFSM